ncbi:STAS domain-containing protein [Saccharopolyspora dendranthemae]|uniref:Anti-anti-sigma factor n=1 Tax=Saccharopolyspora dendranthemae TaxID=1181886 RepID=A0A561U8A5_9PSEU|nr:STAS domain-containing protein [Saccharopolyspora dendranthemae]TWF95581.1 anti-anti-sigma factor [Saccharopolyspora dendranthemae]
MTVESRVSGSLVDEAPALDPVVKAPAPSVQVSFPNADAIVVAVTAPVDQETVAQLETMLWPQPASTARSVVVDLTKMRFLDVPDLQLLTYAHMLVQARGGALHVVADDLAVQEALRASGLHVLLECHTTMSEALRADAR